MDQGIASRQYVHAGLALALGLLALGAAPARAIDAACTQSTNLLIYRCPEESVDWYDSYTDIIDTVDAAVCDKRAGCTITGTLTLSSAPVFSGGLTSTITTNADQFNGTGSAASALELELSSITAQGNIFNAAGRLLKLSAGNQVPEVLLSTNIVLNSSSPAHLPSTQTFIGANTFASSTTFTGGIFGTTRFHGDTVIGDAAADSMTLNASTVIIADLQPSALTFSTSATGTGWFRLATDDGLYAGFAGPSGVFIDFHSGTPLVFGGFFDFGQNGGEMKLGTSQNKRLRLDTNDLTRVTIEGDGYTTFAASVTVLGKDGQRAALFKSSNPAAGLLIQAQNTATSGFAGIEVYDSTGTDIGGLNWWGPGQSGYGSGSLLIGTAKVYPISIPTNNVERIRVDGNGGVTVTSTMSLTATGSNFGLAMSTAIGLSNTTGGTEGGLSYHRANTDLNVGTMTIRMGTWKAYTPTWTATVTNPTLNNGTIEGFYTKIGRTVIVRIRLLVGTTTAMGEGTYRFSLPVTAVTDWHYGGSRSSCGTWASENDGIANYGGGVQPTSTTTIQMFGHSTSANMALAFVTHAAPFTWDDNDHLSLICVYEGT